MIALKNLIRKFEKLGVTEEGNSYLDQFRLLITEIGNAMGFVRMVRSGGLHYCSNAIKFVPDLQNIPNFAEHAGKAGLPTETTQAANNLDGIVDNLVKNFAEGTEYFKALVDVFSEEFRSAQNMHLRNFFVIVPPLTLNFIEHMLVAKDKLQKKGKETIFTDDGFAIGVAYILRLLDKHQDFESLHWFEAVKLRCHEEQKKLHAEKEKTKKKGRLEEQQHTQLTLKRLESLQTEFELLYYSFNGARIFLLSNINYPKSIFMETSSYLNILCNRPVQLKI